MQWLSEREERAWRALQFMQMRLEGALARQLAADSGLSYPDYLVLVALPAALFGAAFLPFARPLVAGLTTLSLLGGWWWMMRRSQSQGIGASSTCASADCGCESVPAPSEAAPRSVQIQQGP